MICDEMFTLGDVKECTASRHLSVEARALCMPDEASEHCRTVTNDLPL